MFGLTFDKLLVIAVVAAVIIGPQRLPHFAATLAGMVKRFRGTAQEAKNRIREELGPEYDDIDWKKLDPRQYDPRQIIRSALLNDDPGAGFAPARASKDRSASIDAASFGAGPDAVDEQESARVDIEK
jgi:sec-independent protein translocase protein TatB